MPAKSDYRTVLRTAEFQVGRKGEPGGSPMYSVQFFGWVAPDDGVMARAWQAVFGLEPSVPHRALALYLKPKTGRGAAAKCEDMPPEQVVRSSSDIQSHMVAQALTHFSEDTEVAAIGRMQVSFFFDDPAQVQPSGTDIIAAVQKVERKVEAVAPAIQEQLSEQHQDLLRLTKVYGGNYAQAAEELGIPLREAVGVVLDGLKN